MISDTDLILGRIKPEPDTIYHYPKGTWKIFVVAAILIGFIIWL